MIYTIAYKIHLLLIPITSVIGCFNLHPLLLNNPRALNGKVFGGYFGGIVWRFGEGIWRCFLLVFKSKITYKKIWTQHMRFLIFSFWGRELRTGGYEQGGPVSFSICLQSPLVFVGCVANTWWSQAWLNFWWSKNAPIRPPFPRLPPKGVNTTRLKRTAL